MKALDTNVLVRFLVRDDEGQANTVYRIFKQAEEDKRPLWVPIVVVLETLWVLESVYEVERENILDAIEDLLLMPTLKFEAQPAIQGLVSSACANNADLPDLLVAFCAKHSGCEAVLTFDRKAARYPLFELIR